MSIQLVGGARRGRLDIGCECWVKCLLGLKEYFVPKSPVVVDEAGVPLKTAIENLNSENMELKSKVGTSIILSR